MKLPQPLVDGAMRSRVLEYLIKYDRHPRRWRFTGGELSRALREPLDPVLFALRELVRNGFVVVEEIERVAYFRVAREDDPFTAPKRADRG